MELKGYRILFGENLKWLNIVLPIALYALIIGWLAWVIYKCYEFLGARVEHDEKRKREKERQKQIEEELMERYGITAEDAFNDEIGELDSNGDNVNAVDEQTSQSPSPPPSIHNGIRMQMFRRTPSNIINGSGRMSVTGPHFHIVQNPPKVIKQWHHTGSLQQLQPLARKPSNSRRIMSISSAVPLPLRRLLHEQSEPTLALLQNRTQFN